MINKSINQAIRDSVNNTTVDLENLQYFVRELSKITIYGFWSKDTESHWTNMMSRGSELGTNFVEDVIDFLLEFNIHLMYNLTGEEYNGLLLSNSGIQVLTREALAYSPYIIPSDITRISFGSTFTVMDPNDKSQSMDRLSTIVFLLRIHIVVFSRELEKKINYEGH